VKLLVLLLALFTAAQSKGAESRIAGLVAALGEGTDMKARSDAYVTLLREKPAAAIPLLSEALPRYDVQGQQYGLWLLQAYPIETTNATLHRLTGEKSPLLAAGAAAKLLQLGEREMLEPLVKAFARKEASSEMRRAMLQQVMLVKEPRLAAIVRTWIAPESDALLLGEVFYHLRWSEDPESRARAQEVGGTPGLPNEPRALCVAFLVSLGEEAQCHTLAELLASDNGALLSRLQRLLLAAPRLSEELLTAIGGVASRATLPAYAQFAIAILGQQAGPKQIPMLEGLLDSSNLHVAKSALEALQKRGVRISRESLVRMLDSKEGLRVLAAADALRRVDDLSGFERVLELVKSGGADKAEAVRSLAKFRRRASVAPLVDALEDKDASVRSAAELGLLNLLPNLFPYRRFSFGTAGFPSQGTPEERAAAMRALRAWCAANLKS
jgi:hypothetical protein